MTDQSSSLRDDIIFMKSLAEQGRRGPILGGAFLAAAGIVFGLACVIHWAMQEGFLPPPTGTSLLVLWGGASVVFAIVWRVLFHRLQAGGQATPGAGQSVFGVAWASCGLGIVVLEIAIWIVSEKTNDPTLFRLDPLVAFAFYAAAWFVSGALAHRRWMYLSALASLAMTLILAVVSGPGMLLVMGGGLFVTLVLPGFALKSQASR